MHRLNKEEIKELSGNFSDMTIEDTMEIADIFYNLKSKKDYRLQNTELDTVKDYIEEYCNSWYKYKTFDELVKSEFEQGEAYGLNEQECQEQIGQSIFKLKSGWYIQCVY